MKYFIALVLLTTSHAFAGLNMKPGLWTVTTKMKTADGKERNVQEGMDKMQAALAKMSPEQRKQMEAMQANMMKKLGQDPSQKMAFGFDSKGIQICYTDDLLKDGSALAQQKAQHDCETSIPVKTSNRIVSEFKCKNGTSGTAEWNVKDPTHYSGSVKMTSKDGKKSEINHEGSFVSSDCGNVAPLADAMKKKLNKK